MHLYILYIDTKNIYKEKKKTEKIKEKQAGFKKSQIFGTTACLRGLFLTTERE